MAKHSGASVTGVCGPRNLELVASLGADTVIDYTTQDVTAAGERYQLIFVAVGDRVGPPSERDCRRILTPDGVYIAVDHGHPNLRAEDLRRLTSLAESGALTPVIDRRYPLAELAQAHRYVEQAHKKGNVVVVDHG